MKPERRQVTLQVALLLDVDPITGRVARVDGEGEVFIGWLGLLDALVQVTTKTGGITVLKQDSYLLQNQMNPFPIAGELALSDDGRLSFTLGAKAAEASLGWLQKAMATGDLKQRITSGERPVVFDLPVAERKIVWPKTLGGYGMKIADDDRRWIVTLNYPSGGALWQVINMVNSKGTAKPWKEALAAGGAK